MVTCPSCGRDLAEGFAFCPHCGAAISAPAGSDERKLVTVLFADVSGSTRLAEALDAEVVRDLMAAYFALAREEIEAQGGTVEKFIGDAVMAVFGVPLAHEDDPTRALRAALGIQSRLDGLNERLRGEDQPELTVRIGINSGEVVASAAPRPGEVMVTGDAVNVAARVQQLARPGQTLVGQRTVAAARGFEFRPIGRQPIRGKSMDVAVSELLREVDGREPRASVMRAPLVGRDGELALLTSLYDRVAADGRPHLVTLYGQPGVGKSRLSKEFLDSLAGRERPPDVIRGRCLSYGSGVTFWPLAEILKSRAGILDTDASGDAVSKLAALRTSLFGADLAEDPDRTMALLGFTVGIAMPEFDFSRMDRDQMHAAMSAAWTTFFSALARRHPTVVVIEDIHWAEAVLLDLLDELGARAQGSLLILCPARPDLTDRRPGWGGGRRSFSSVFLDPLNADDASHLVSLLLEIEDLPGDLHDRIVDRAGGNPFFVEEILRHLIDQGQISSVGSGWRAEPGLTAVAIPDSVQAVLAARVDLLAPQEKRTLQAAAVVGRIFWTVPIARSLGVSVADVAALLRALEGRDLVITRFGTTIAGEAEFIFKHALVRDVAYESIPRRDRAAAHLEVARWIEETVGERRLEVIELLAHHYTEAQRASTWGRLDPERGEEIRSRAVELLFDAAEEAGRRFALDRARERVDTGLAMAQGPVERARGLEARGQIMLWLGDGDQAWTAAREAIDLRAASAPSTPEDRRAVARLCGLLLAVPTRWPGLMLHLPSRDDAQTYLDLGFSMLADGDSEERLGLLMVRAFWSWGFAAADDDADDNAEYLAAADNAVDLARRLDKPDLLSRALDAAGAASLRQSGIGYGAAQALQEERLDLIPRLDDLGEVLDILFTNTWNLAHIGEYRRVLEVASRSPGDPRGHGVELFAGVAHFRLGAWDQFWATFELVDAAVDPDQPMQYHQLRLYGIAAYLRTVSGDAAAAHALIARIDATQATRGSVGVSGARPWIVQALLREDRLDEARRRLEVVDPLRGRQNHDVTLEARAELIAAAGSWDEAPALITEARQWASDGGLRALPAVADRLEGLAALAAGDGATGVECLTRARATFAELESVWERARTELGLGEALGAAGRRVEAASMGQAALATLETLDAPLEILRARALCEAPRGGT